MKVIRPKRKRLRRYLGITTFVLLCLALVSFPALMVIDNALHDSPRCVFGEFILGSLIWLTDGPSTRIQACFETLSDWVIFIPLLIFYLGAGIGLIYAWAWNKYVPKKIHKNPHDGMFEIRGNAILAGHDLEEFEPVEGFTPGYEARCRYCDKTVWIGENGIILSKLGDVCEGKGNPT